MKPYFIIAIVILVISVLGTLFLSNDSSMTIILFLFD
jgi:hypothetical protein